MHVCSAVLLKYLRTYVFGASQSKQIGLNFIILIELLTGGDVCSFGLKLNSFIALWSISGDRLVFIVF